ncbi:MULTISPECIES: cardiolipin synthase [Photobacterium]|uniref:Cardiolipin synthase A n=1 Tax=Photobacterium ganghwense TaxID=320778 RepID=A0A0J1HIB4_9GAMM|nr:MULTISPECIES: cardiolipin synthase [Photobacterium]KLV11346.1 cardiolipin synthetase [Photobacterium ganghwense]MBV1840631.1 cardiolipin synthase [Photobacterium ganghwense]PSU08196.1 cardiolipin synthase [Photobacterium ganghwense]
MEKFYQVLAWASLFIYWLSIAAVTMRIVFKRRVVGVSLAWLLIIYIIPIGGIMAYLLLGELNLGRKRAERARDMFDPFAEWFQRLNDCPGHQPHLMSEHARPLNDLCENRLGIPALSGNSLSLQDSPQAILRSLIDDIHQAKSSIHMEFYIWHPGGLADEIATALIMAAKRGVEIRILLDSAGSMRFFRSHWPRLMRHAGIQLVEALAVSPLRVFLRRMDLRQHRKIVVIDSRIGFTGSMNLVDPAYFKTNAGVGQWIDVMVRMTGPSVTVLNTIQAWDWEVETGERYLPRLPECHVPSVSDDADTVQVIPSGPGMPDEIIHQVLLLSIYQAKESVVITTPYFVPSENLLHAMKAAAQRGVAVDLVIPDKNDSLMVEWASRSFFSELLNAGVRIHRFHGGLLHTKSVVIDRNHCLIGTVNLDMRSLWLNFEVTLAVDNAEFTQQLNWVQQEYIKQSTRVRPEEWEKRPIINKLVEQFFYMFSPLL